MAGVKSMPAIEPLDCVFRSEVRGEAATESAQCLLIAQMLGLPPEQTRVTRPLCEICIEQTRGRAFSEHPIFPSLVYHQATEQLTAVHDTASQKHWETWLARAEAALLQQAKSLPEAGSIPLCDVILCAEQDSPELRAAMESVLDQCESVPILHVIDCGTEPIDWGDDAARWNVQIHRLPGPVTPLSVVSQISSALRTPYLAVQHPSAISEPLRLARSIRALRDTGAEISVAGVLLESGPKPLPECAEGDCTAEAAEDRRGPRDLRNFPLRASAASAVKSEHLPQASSLAGSPTDDEDSSNPEASVIIPWSLAVRRATLVDMGVTASGRLETEADFLSEAYRQGRPVVTSSDPVVSADDPTALDSPSAGDLSRLIRKPTRTFAPSPLQPRSVRRNRFPNVPTSCDVVLPFRGHLHYVREALDGLLKQEQVTPVIHLIDDATVEDTTDFLNEWAKHPQLRVYRNRENIGQFQSFNNTAPFWETDLVAVQDADDISLPHRLHWAGQMLHWSGADYFGGAVELFGDEDLIRPVMSETKALERIRRADYRRSFYPQWAKTDYFLENPTAVFRTAMFREMGGYADFGSRLMNRTSLDTEFQLRCLFRGVRFAITREVVTRYRVHPESATQDRLTGWGTTPRAASIRQLEERCRVFRGGDFDPRTFGALGRYTGVTQPWLVSRGLARHPSVGRECRLEVGVVDILLFTGVARM